MNIFKILSSNDGSINEPNISSFLSYLLNPNEDHGLSSLLLQEILYDLVLCDKKFLEKIQSNGKITDLSNLSDFDIKIIPEFSVYIKSEKNKRRDIDILVEIYSHKENELLYSVCIENKITDSSINKKDNQLEEEIIGLQNYYKELEISPEIYLVYLTPFPSLISEDSFKKLEYAQKGHIYWNNHEKSILNKLIYIFSLENNGVIDPITEQVMFLIKSFLSFIRTGFKSYIEEKAEKIEKRNYGKPAIDHLNDYVQKLNSKTIYNIDEIRISFAEYVEKESGIPLHKATRNAKILLATVNEKNRIHYGIKANDDDRKNIFYYPNINNKKEIMLFDKKNSLNIKIEYQASE